MVKKILFTLFAVLLFGFCGFTACGKEEKSMGQFYTLQDAYDSGLLTVENLQIIANYLNNGTLPTDNLSSKIETAIKKTAAEKMRNDKLNPISEAKAEGFGVRYYGSYNGNIAVIMDNVYQDYITEDLDITVEVAGISFHYNSLRMIEIWSQY